MNLRNLLAALMLLTLVSGCGQPVKPATELVSWADQDGRTTAMIEKRLGMEIAYVSEQGTVERITVAVEPPIDDRFIELSQLPFLLKLLNEQPLLFSGPQFVPCIAGDDCVPPVPPQLEGVF